MKIVWHFCYAWIVVAMSAVLGGCIFDLSPDGEMAAFMYLSREKSGLGLMAVNDAQLQVVADARDGVVDKPRWSPDGKTIIFAQSRSQGFASLAKVKIYDIERRQLKMVSSGKDVAALEWRPDGKSFVVVRQFMSRGPKEPAYGEAVWHEFPSLRVARRLKLPQFEAGPRNQRVLWPSQNDNIILLSGSMEFKAQIYLIRGNSIQKIGQLTDIVGIGLSSDKKKILLATNTLETSPALALKSYDLQTRAMESLSFSQQLPLQSSAPRKPFALEDVVFAPDGQRLALLLRYHAGNDPKTKEKQKRIVCYSMKIDGTDARFVRRTLPFSRESGPDHFPRVLSAVSWSRDSKKMGVFLMDSSGPNLYVHDADGRNGRKMPIPGLK